MDSSGRHCGNEVKKNIAPNIVQQHDIHKEKIAPSEATVIKNAVRDE